MAVEAATVGQSFKVEGLPHTYTVKESCGGEAGRWHCITCDTGFANQFEKDTHISAVLVEGGSEHVLCWICAVHGPEAP